MAPDKEWIRLVDDRLHDPSYEIGVEEFLTYACQKIGADKIRCPCVRCVNTSSIPRDVVKTHLMVYGILSSYTLWYHHGETGNESESDSDTLVNNDEGDNDVDDDEMLDLLEEMHPSSHNFDRNDGGMGNSNHNDHEEEPNTEAKRFFRLLDDLNQPLSKGSKGSKLSALVKLLHLKSLGKWSNHSFTLLLELLKDELFPGDSPLPTSYYEANKTIKDLGCSNDKIDACVNDCMLFRKEDSGLDKCKICNTSRWKYDKHNGEEKLKANGKKVPAKILRYFPLKPRLQKLFMSSKTSSLMRWHHDKEDDGNLNHPADSLARKKLNELHGTFSAEPRNVRLGLASDGFQPFNNCRSSYSTWPVILIPYNLPPWMCMKQTNLILSLLIPGPDGPGNCIDVYLQPLIDELLELWNNGIQTFDVTTLQNFNLRAAVLWTINDFPAYGILSGWSTKGKLACPCFHKGTHSIRLTNGRKECFMGHMRYLPLDHRWRKNKSAFDGTIEKGTPSTPLSGDDVLIQVQSLEGNVLSKCSKKVSHKSRGDNWNKKSIFFKLPYWKDLLIRHTLDVMHIEKNICDSILGTLMNVKNKTKDNYNSRLDLQAMNIRQELHPMIIGGKTGLPHASFTLSVDGKRRFLRFLKDLKVPDGFSSNISQCVNLKENKLLGLKSHDHHILLHHILPLALRGLVPKDVYEPLLELSRFFKVLGNKCLDMGDLKQIEVQIAITLCKLEQIFPPSFFDVMLHFPIHLSHEAMLYGPVHDHWMYLIERYLYTLKSYICNRCCPEGSIAEGFIAEECMNLCSRYLHTVETRFNHLDRNYDDYVNECATLSIFSYKGRGLGCGTTRDLDVVEWEKSHIYILNNCEEVKSFIEEYYQAQGVDPDQISIKDLNEDFIEWFKMKIGDQHVNDKSKKTDELLSLSRGPLKCVKCFYGYIVNGYRFHTKSHDERSRSQCSGVTVVGDDGSGMSRHYYAQLTEIIELQYLGSKRVVLFLCDWFDVAKGVQTDAYGFMSVDCKRIWKTIEPFILATQASQVFYANDQINKGWHIVTKIDPGDKLELVDDTNDAHDDPMLIS